MGKKKAAKTASQKSSSTKKSSTKKSSTKKSSTKKSSTKGASEAKAGSTVESAMVDDGGQRWLPAEKDYWIGLLDGKLACKNPKGRQLASVPKWLKESELSQELLELRDWQLEHATHCMDTVELWMLRSLPVPRAVLAAVWEDPAWRRCLNNAVVCAASESGIGQQRAGFLRAIGDEGLGIVDLDGETQWLDVELAALPHPILLDELDDFRELSVELQITQGADQLFRQTWQLPKNVGDEYAVKEFADGKFEQLNFALGHCRRLGYRVRGGNACCPVWEDGKLFEARYWIGAEYPEGETWTGTLGWVDSREAGVPIKEVGPVAYSEGMRMAAAIYAKRAVEDEAE